MKQTQFSARSQRGFIHEEKMRATRAEISLVVAKIERDIEQLTANRKRWLESSVNHKGGAEQMKGKLRASLEQLEDLENELKVERERLATADSELKKLEMTPARAKERAANQDRLGSVEGERLAKDAAIQAKLDEFRELLKGRAELSAQMNRIGSALDTDTDFDEARFNALLAALPEDVLKESRRWSAWFNGHPLDAQTFVVRAPALHFPETLAHHGVYHQLDRVELAQADAAPLLTSGEIVTLAEFEAATEDAEARGIAVAELWAYLDHAKASLRHKDELAALVARGVPPPEGQKHFSSVTEALQAELT